MKIAIILNGISRKKKKFYKEIYPALAGSFTIDILETRYAGHAEALALQAASQEVSIIIAAGGDGTLSQVINGVIKSGVAVLPTVGLIPLGSGNDFARTCELSSSPGRILELLTNHQPKTTDVGEIICTEKGTIIRRYFINVCSLGMGPEVVKRLTNSHRAWGPSLSYLLSIVAVFFTHKPQRVHCKTSNWEWSGITRVLAIANGKSFGHAIYIAPDASPDDGFFDTFVAGALPLWKFLYCLESIKSKRKIKDSMIHYNRATEIEITAPEPCLLEAEGEMVGMLPASIKILPGKIMFLR